MIMPPNPDVLQIRLGALVTLVFVRDREAREYKIVIQHHGLVDQRTSVPIAEQDHARVAAFLAVPLYPKRKTITDEEPFVPPSPDDETTKPE